MRIQSQTKGRVAGGSLPALSSVFLLACSLAAANVGGGGDGGVVCAPRYYDSSSASGSVFSGSTFVPASGMTSGTDSSLQATFASNPSLQFFGAQSIVANLDVQMLAMGSLNSKVRVAPSGIGAAGQVVDITIPHAALNGVATFINLSCVGDGGVVLCSNPGGPTTYGVWNGPLISVELAAVLQNPALWGTPITLQFVPADASKAVKLTITAEADGSRIRLLMTPNSN